MVDEKTAPKFDCVMQSCYSEKDELTSYLIEHGYLVGEKVDETKEVLEVGRKFNEIENVMRLVILPAETCNFACPYCFIYKMRNRYMQHALAPKN